MKRILIPLGVALAVLPVLLRTFSGHPWFAGTQAYELMILTGLPEWLLLALALGALSGALALTPMLFSTVKLENHAEDIAVLLLALSPVTLGALVVFPLHALLLLLLMVGLWAVQRKHWIFAGTLSVAFASILTWSLDDFSFSVTRTLVELGGQNAYGIFALIAAIVGTSVLWENKARNYFLALGVGILVIASFALQSLVLLGSVAVALIAGLGYARLWHRRWVFGSIRGLSLILFACGIIFSSMIFIFEVSDAAPTGGFASDLAAVRHALPEGMVFSILENKPWIEYWTGRELVTDDVVWRSRNLSDTFTRLQGVSAIIITKEMKTTLWNDQEEGLLFLLNNSKTFKRLGDGNFVEVWAIQ